MNADQLRFAARTECFPLVAEEMVTVWLNGAWRSRQALLKPPFFLIVNNTNQVDTFWILQETTFLERSIADAKKLYNVADYSTDNAVIVLSRTGDEPLLFIAQSKDFNWLKAFRDNIVDRKQVERMETVLENQRHTYWARVKKNDEANEILRQTCEKLEKEVSRLAEANAQLSIAGSAAETAANELLEQKTTELDFVRQLVLKRNEEIEKLKSRSSSLREALERKETALQKVQKDLSAMRERYTILRADVEAAELGGQDNLVLQLAARRNRIQELTLDNKRLRKELKTGIENFQRIRRQYQDRMRELEEMLSFDTLFDLLKYRTQLADCQLLMHQGDIPKAEVEKIEQTLVNLRRDIWIKETEARAQYINWRSMLISKQLDICCGDYRDEDTTHLTRKILDRYRWLLQRAEVTEAEIPWAALAAEGFHSSYGNLSWLLTQRFFPSKALGGLDNDD